MQNKHFHFAFNFLCVFDLSIKKQKKKQPNKQKNKRINIVKIAAQRGGQAEESYWEQKQLERDRRKKKRTK